MILISHRGNTVGSEPDKENSPDYIEKAIFDGYDCEIDVWLQGKDFYLGHDYPQYNVGLGFILKHSSKLWCHAKDIKSLTALLENNVHCFWHEVDQCTLTSENIIWHYPSSMYYKNGINVMPELNNLKKENLENCYGICSDYVWRFK